MATGYPITEFASRSHSRKRANGPVTQAIAAVRNGNDEPPRRGVVAGLLALVGLTGVGTAVAVASSPDEFQAPREGQGAIVLNGRPVFFDTSRYPATGEPVLVAFGDGRIEVTTMPDADSDPRRALNPGFLMVSVDRPMRNGMRVIREQAALIGAVRA